MFDEVAGDGGVVGDVLAVNASVVWPVAFKGFANDGVEGLAHVHAEVGARDYKCDDVLHSVERCCGLCGFGKKDRACAPNVADSFYGGSLLEDSYGQGD